MDSSAHTDVIASKPKKAKSRAETLKGGQPRLQFLTTCHTFCHLFPQGGTFGLHLHNPFVRRHSSMIHSTATRAEQSHTILKDQAAGRDVYLCLSRRRVGRCLRGGSRLGERHAPAMLGYFPRHADNPALICGRAAFILTSAPAARGCGTFTDGYRLCRQRVVRWVTGSLAAACAQVPLGTPGARVM